MTMTGEIPKQDQASSVTQRTAHQHPLEQLSVASRGDKRFLQEYRLSLRQQRESLEQERLLYQQERQRLWNDWQTPQQGGARREDRGNLLRSRMRLQEDFSNELSSRRQSFAVIKQAFAVQLAALQDRHVRLQDIPDHQQQQEGYRQLRATYRELQEQLQDYQQLLHEQRDGYHQLRQEYARQVRDLHAFNGGRRFRKFP